jgi:DNA invertase Pin-like site-specific DNA recombinase
MISCFGYIRVSTQRQGEGVSLEAQRTAIEQCAQQRGLVVTEWFEELETASKAGRPVFNNMVGRLKRHHAEGLVVHKLDRSARNLRDWNTVSELMDLGITFHIATEPIDFSTRGGRMTADFLAVIATDFSRNQREETKKGLNGRLLQGLFPFKAPLGYLDQGKGKPKVPCPERAPMIQAMYELYQTGEYSLKSLHIEMERRGLRNHFGSTLSLHGVEKILSNPFYHGQILIVRTGETFDGIHEPIVTQTAYKRVQAIKAQRCGPKVSKHRHAFVGLFRCANCEGPLVPERQRMNVYYRCHRQACSMTTIREDRLDVAIRKDLARLQLTPITIKKMRLDWESGSILDDLNAQRRSLASKIEDRQSKISRMADLLIDRSLDQNTYDEKKKEFGFELSCLQGQLDGLPNPQDVRHEREEYVETMKSLVATYDMGNTTERRQLLRNTFSARRADVGNVQLEVRSWVGVHFTSRLTPKSQKLTV